MKYGKINVEEFCEAFLSRERRKLESDADVIDLVANRLAFEVMETYKDFEIDPLVIMQAALDKVRDDSIILVNQMPTELL